MILRNLLCALAVWLAFAPAASAYSTSPAQTVQALWDAPDLITLPAVEVAAPDAPADLVATATATQAFDVAYAPAGRLRFASSSAVPPVTTQTFYFGPKTLVGFGGARPVGMAATATAPSTTSYYWDTTYQWAAPRNGGTTTYGSTRAAPLSGCEVMTVTDSAATVFTLNLCADQTIAGDYTWRWRPGDTQSSSSGTNQLFKSFAASAYGEHLVMRRGTTLNTTADTGGYNGTAAFRFACAIGNCNYAGFNGSNHRVIRPELGQTNTIGPIWFEGAAVGGTKFIDFTIDNEASTYTLASQGYMLKDSTASAGMIFENLIITGSNTDPTGKNRPGGITVDVGGTPDIINSTISYVTNGIVVSMGLGTSADIFAGSTAPVQERTIITGNTLTEIGRDNLTVQCPRYLYVANNLFTDQKTEYTVGDNTQSPPYTNPFDSARQPHSDHVQMNFQNTPTNACAYNYYPDVTFIDNFFGRGNGHDTLPYWVSPPVPTPNDYAGGTQGSNAGIIAQAKVGAPNPLASLGDSQGLYTSNFAAGTKSNGGVTRPYVTTLDAPAIERNIITTVFNAGIALPGVRNGTVVANSVLGPRVATSTNLETWSGFGNAGVIIDSVEGTPTIARNYGNTSSVIGPVTSPPASQVVEVTIPQYGTVFNNPTGSLSPRTPTEFRLYYRPVVGQALDLGGGAYAGAVCPNGSVNSGATC